MRLTMAMQYNANYDIHHGFEYSLSFWNLMHGLCLTSAYNGFYDTQGKLHVKIVSLFLSLFLQEKNTCLFDVLMPGTNCDLGQ